MMLPPNLSLKRTARRRRILTRRCSGRARRLLRFLVRQVLNYSIVRLYAPTALIPRRMAIL